MNIKELIKELENKLKENGNIEVKIFNYGEFSNFSLNVENDICDIGVGNYVPVPVILIEGI